MIADLNSEALLDSLTSGALVVQQDGRVIYANPCLWDLCHLEEANLSEISLKTLLKLPPKTDCALCLGSGSADHPQWATYHGAFLLTSPQQGHPGELRVKVKHSQLPDGTILCLIDPFSEDTTLTQAHSDFVSTVSHEFRTPLTSIKGFADTLLAYGAQLPDEEKRRFITIIKDQAERLIRLVENLLTVSKLGASRVEMSYRPVPLQKLADKVIHSVQAKLQVKQAGGSRRFDVMIHPSSLEVWGDPDRLEQILLNLVDNAVKYSPANSTVYIRGEVLPEDEQMVRISVRDEGVGIAEDALPKIFTKFYRVESPLKQEVEGTGLGLYITRSLTNALGGQLFAESTPGQGSTFTVVFPAATPQRQAAYQRTQYAAGHVMDLDTDWGGV